MYTSKYPGHPLPLQISKTPLTAQQMFLDFMGAQPFCVRGKTPDTGVKPPIPSLLTKYCDNVVLGAISIMAKRELDCLSDFN